MQKEVVMTGCRALFYHPHEGAKKNRENFRQYNFHVSRDEQSTVVCRTSRQARMYSHASLNDGDTF
jgi:hypothetical protein